MLYCRCSYVSIAFQVSIRENYIVVQYFDYISHTHRSTLCSYDDIPVSHVLRL